MEYFLPFRVCRPIVNLQQSNAVKRFAVATLLTGASWEFNDTLRFMERPFNDTDASPAHYGYFRVLWFFILLDKRVRRELQPISSSKVCELMMEPLEAKDCCGSIGVRLWLMFMKEVDDAQLTEMIERTLTEEPLDMPSRGETVEAMRRNFFDLFHPVGKSRKGKRKQAQRGNGGGGSRGRPNEDEEEQQQQQEDDPQQQEPEPDTSRISNPVSIHFRFMKMIGNPYTNNYFINQSLNEGQFTNHHMLFDVFDTQWAFRESYRGLISDEQMNMANYFSTITVGDSGETRVQLMPDRRLTNELHSNFSISEDCFPSNFGPNSPNPHRLFAIFRPVLPKRTWDHSTRTVVITRDYWKRPVQPSSSPPVVQQVASPLAAFGRPINPVDSLTDELDRLNERAKMQASQLYQIITQGTDSMNYLDWLRSQNDSISLRHRIDVFMKRRLDAGESMERCQRFVKTHGMNYFFDMLSSSENLPAPLVEQVKWWRREYPDMRLVNQHMKRMHLRLRTNNLSYFAEFIVSMNTLWHRMGDIRKNFKETWMLYCAVDASVFYLAPYSSNGKDEGIRGWIVYISPFGSGKTHFQDFIASISLNGAVDKTTYNSRLAGTGGVEGPGMFDQTAVVKIWDEAKTIVDPPKGDHFSMDFLKNVATSAQQRYKHLIIDPETKQRRVMWQNCRVSWIAVLNLNEVPPSLTENSPFASRVWVVHMAKQMDQMKHVVSSQLKNDTREYLTLFSWFVTLCIHMINSGVLNEIDTTMFTSTIDYFNQKNPSMVIDERRRLMLMSSVLSMTVKFAVWAHIFCRQVPIHSLKEAFRGIDDYLVVTRECTLWVLSLYSKELYSTDTPEPLKKLFQWPPPLKGMKCSFRNSNSGSNFEYQDLPGKQVDRMVIRFDTKVGMLNSLANAINRQSKNGQYNGDMVWSFINRQQQVVIEDKGYVLTQENAIWVPAFIDEDTSIMFIEVPEYHKLMEALQQQSVIVLKLHLLIKVADKYHHYERRKLWVERNNNSKIMPKLRSMTNADSILEFTGDPRQFKITPVTTTHVDNYCLFKLRYKRPVTSDGKPEVPRGSTLGEFQDSQTPLLMSFQSPDGGPLTLNCTSPQFTEASLSNIPSTFIEDPSYKRSTQQSVYYTPGGPQKPWELNISLTWMKDAHEKRSFEQVLKDTFSTSTTTPDTLLLSGKYMPGSAYVFDTFSLTNNPLNKECYSNLNFFDANQGQYDMDYVGTSKEFQSEPMQELFRDRLNPTAYEMLTSERKRQMSSQPALDELERHLGLSPPNVRTTEYHYPEIVLPKGQRNRQQHPSTTTGEIEEERGDTVTPMDTNE